MVIYFVCWVFIPSYNHRQRHLHAHSPSAHRQRHKHIHTQLWIPLDVKFSQSTGGTKLESGRSTQRCPPASTGIPRCLPSQRYFNRQRVNTWGFFLALEISKNLWFLETSTSSVSVSARLVLVVVVGYFFGTVHEFRFGIWACGTHCRGRAGAALAASDRSS